MTGKALKLIRTLLALDERQAASAAGITEDTLKQIESDLAEPSLKLLKAFEDAYNVRGSTILYLSEALDDTDLKSESKLEARNMLSRLLARAETAQKSAAAPRKR